VIPLRAALCQGANRSSYTIPKGVEILDLHPVDVIISLINITVLFLLLRMILWKHVIRFLSERANRVRSDMDDAEQRRLEVDALRLEYDEKLGSIEERGRDLMLESRQRADEEADRILRETKETANGILRDAQNRITIEKQQALEEAELDIARLATDMAARILEREVSESDNVKVVDEFFRE